MSTEATPSVRKDALVAAIALLALGLLWLLFRLYWQGLLLVMSAGLVALLVLRRRRLAPGHGRDAPPEVAEARPGPVGRRGSRSRKAKGGRKRRRRK